MVSKSNQEQRVYRNENGVCIVSFAKKVVNESQKLSNNPEGKFIIYKSEDNVENLSESEMKDPLLVWNQFSIYKKNLKNIRVFIKIVNLYAMLKVMRITQSIKKNPNRDNSFITNLLFQQNGHLWPFL